MLFRAFALAFGLLAFVTGCGGGKSQPASPPATPACSDGLDNDADTLIDLADPGCTNAADTDEAAIFPFCSDRLDNDGDTLIDFPNDPGCANANSGTEAPQCNDRTDNDGDTLVDLADSDCTSASDATEGPPPPVTTTIHFSTYLGNDKHDFVRDVAVDASGNVYAVGGAESSDLPTTTGQAFGGYEDAFVAKFNDQGALLWARFLGGAELDRAYAVEVSGNDVIIAGRAGASFPVTAGVIQGAGQFQGSSTVANVYPQPQDGFVAKLNATNGALVWATWFGASSDTHANVIRDIAVDPNNGFIYLAASTVAGGVYPTAILSAFSRGFQSSQQGGIDGVLAKLSSDGTTMPWATYVGGSADENAQPSVRIDSQGRPVVLFRTESPNAPTTLGAHDRQLDGLGDFYVSRYAVNGAREWATFVGGNDNEGVETHNLAIRSDDTLVIAGATRSTTDFAVTGAYDETQNGNGGTGTGVGTNYPTDCGIAILAANGSSLLGATYYGGSVGEACEGVGADSNGNIYVTGGTYSSTLIAPNFPITAGAYRSTKPGTISPFIAVFNRDLTRLRYSSYYGGSGNAIGRDLVVKGEAHFVFGGEVGVGFPTVNAVRAAPSVTTQLHGGVADVLVPLGPG